jgi:hypothetical protein
MRAPAFRPCWPATLLVFVTAGCGSASSSPQARDSLSAQSRHVAVATTYNRASASKGAGHEEACASLLRGDRGSRNRGPSVCLERLRAELRHPLQAERGRSGRRCDGQAGRRLGDRDLSTDRGGNCPVELAELRHFGAPRLANRLGGIDAGIRRQAQGSDAGAERAAPGRVPELARD